MSSWSEGRGRVDVDGHIHDSPPPPHNLSPFPFLTFRPSRGQDTPFLSMEIPSVRPLTAEPHSPLHVAIEVPIHHQKLTYYRLLTSPLDSVLPLDRQTFDVTIGQCVAAEQTDF